MSACTVCCTIQYRTVLIIFLHIRQTIIIAQMLSIGGNWLFVFGEDELNGLLLTISDTSSLKPTSTTVRRWKGLDMLAVL